LSLQKEHINDSADREGMTSRLNEWSTADEDLEDINSKFGLNQKKKREKREKKQL